MSGFSAVTRNRSGPLAFPINNEALEPVGSYGSKKAVDKDDPAIPLLGNQQLADRAVTVLPPASIPAPAVAPVSASANVISYYVSQVFSCKNSPNLIASTLITASTCALMAVTPFLFAEALRSDDTEILGIKLTTFQVVALYTTALFLSKILPITRKMVHNPVVSRTTYNTVYNYDQQDLKQSHSYQVKTHLGVKTDALTTAIVSSADFTSQSLNNLFPAVFELSTAIGILYSKFSWEVGTWVTGVTATSIVYNTMTAGFIRRAFAAYKQGRMAHFGYLTGLWTNFESLQYFNTLEYELKKVRGVVDNAQFSDLANFQVPDRISLVHNIIAQSALMGLILYSGKAMVDGDINIQDLYIIIYFVVQMGIPLNNLGESLNKMRGAYQDLIPVIRFINDRPLPVSFPRLIIPATGPKINFNHVTFNYNQETILDDISFEAEAGQTIALVGITGAGKSTIARLLFRLYDPTEGSITINGQDVTQVDIHSLRNHMGIVPQNPVLFNDTIRYNIAYGAISTVGLDAVTDFMIWEALTKAGLADKVRTWQKGLDTIVGQGALRLSGGELLRVAIARAIIRDAPIIVLDEYTAALDAETEQEIQGSMNVALQGKLKIVIAHRLSTIQDADQIIVLNNGKIAEQGKFDDLMGKGGLFKGFWDKQHKP